MSNFFPVKEKVAKRIIIIVSALIFGIVAVLFYGGSWFSSTGIDVSFLPPFHAALNFSVAVLLVAAFRAIKQKHRKWHQRLMTMAFILSSVFLLSYVTYHSMSEPTAYGGTGALKGVYYAILLSHILLAAIILPLVLLTFYFSWSGKYPQHKKIARWTLPLWLYVAITGVLVYWMISPYYA